MPFHRKPAVMSARAGYRCPVILRGALLACFLSAPLLLLGCLDRDGADGILSVQGPDGAEWAPALSPRGGIKVAVTGELVSVKAQEASVEAVVHEIARQCGFEIITFGPLEGRVTLEFDRLPLSEALRRILHDASFALDHSQGLIGTGARGLSSKCARKLWVLSQPSAPGQPVQIAVQGGNNFDLGGLAETVSMDTLGSALAQGNVNERVDALATLATMEDDATAASMAGAALSDQDAAVREGAVYALGRIGDEYSRPLITEALGDPDVEVREAAIQALENIGGDESAKAIGQVLADANCAVRSAAVDSIAEIGGTTAIQLLRQVSVNEKGVIAELAAEHLARLSTSAWVTPSS